LFCPRAPAGRVTTSVSGQHPKRPSSLAPERLRHRACWRHFQSALGSPTEQTTGRKPRSDSCKRGVCTWICPRLPTHSPRFSRKGAVVDPACTQKPTHLSLQARTESVSLPQPPAPSLPPTNVPSSQGTSARRSLKCLSGRRPWVTREYFPSTTKSIHNCRRLGFYAAALASRPLARKCHVPSFVTPACGRLSRFDESPFCRSLDARC
jgi:hypothetical protein